LEDAEASSDKRLVALLCLGGMLLQLWPIVLFAADLLNLSK
jgi:hypothetical protein